MVAVEGLEINLAGEPDFSIKVQQEDEIEILVLKGRFDAYGAEVFTEQFDRLLRQNDKSRIVLSMQYVTELSMAGVKALLEARKQTFSLALVQLPGHVRRVLELAVTVDFFAIYEDMDTALEALKASGNHRN